MSGLIGQDILAELLNALEPSMQALLRPALDCASFCDETLIIPVPNIYYKQLIEKSLPESLIKNLRERGIKNIRLVIDHTNSSRYASEATTQQTAAESYRDIGRIPVDPLKVFSSVIVGGSNELAYHACRYFVSNDIQLLFMHGPSSSGKTHLLHAIGNDLIKAGKKIYYLPSELFVTEYVMAIKNKRITSFRNNLHASDVLLFDDFDYLLKRASFLNEFSQLLNSFMLHNKRMVVTSLRHPATYNIDTRLKNRICSGLVIQTKLPSPEMKRSCVKLNLDGSGYDHDSEVVNAIASSASTFSEILSNTRKVMIFSQIKKQRITMALVSEILQVDALFQDPLIAKVAEVVSSSAGVGKDFFMTNSRRTSHQRHMLCYLLHKCFGMSTRQIADAISSLSHSSVSYAIRTVEYRMRMNKSFEREVGILLDKSRRLLEQQDVRVAEHRS